MLPKHSRTTISAGKHGNRKEVIFFDYLKARCLEGRLSDTLRTDCTNSFGGGFGFSPSQTQART